MSCPVCKAKAKQLKKDWDLQICIDVITEILHSNTWCYNCVPTSIEAEMRSVNFAYLKEKPMKTQKEHIANGGQSCPKCNSDQIEGSEVTIDTGKTYQEMTCLECNAQWEDIYDLTSFRWYPNGRITEL